MPEGTEGILPLPEEQQFASDSPATKGPAQEVKTVGQDAVMEVGKTVLKEGLEEIKEFTGDPDNYVTPASEKDDPPPQEKASLLAVQNEHAHIQQLEGELHSLPRTPPEQALQDEAI